MPSAWASRPASNCPVTDELNDICVRAARAVGGVAGLGDLVRIAGAQGFEQAQAERRVEVLVQIDVALEVVMEDRRLCLGHRHAREEGAEHGRDDMLAPQSQGGGDRQRTKIARTGHGC